MIRKNKINTIAMILYSNRFFFVEKNKFPSLFSRIKKGVTTTLPFSNSKVFFPDDFDPKYLRI